MPVLTRPTQSYLMGLLFILPNLLLFFGIVSLGHSFLLILEDKNPKFLSWDLFPSYLLFLKYLGSRYFPERGLDIIIQTAAKMLVFRQAFLTTQSTLA